MTESNAPGATADPQNLAQQLAPTICRACDDRLTDLSWFRTDWQRGGAGTARARFADQNGDASPVVLKVPVGRQELTWLRRLQSGADDSPCAPRLYASDSSCGGYDLAWVVIEYFEHGPLGAHWDNEFMPLVADAIAWFYAAASQFPVDKPAPVETWDDLLARSRSALKSNELPQHGEWSKMLKAVSRQWNQLVDEWNARDTSHWLHGDLHPANAMSRSEPGAGPVCLIDFAEVRSGHWVEDAVYFERQFWSRRDLLKAMRPVAAIAKARKAQGLPVEPEYPRMAMLRRVLLAATAPAFLRSEGSPAHLDACLNWLQVGLAEFK